MLVEKLSLCSIGQTSSGHTGCDPVNPAHTHTHTDALFHRQSVGHEDLIKSRLLVVRIKINEITGPSGATYVVAFRDFPNQKKTESNTEFHFTSRPTKTGNRLAPGVCVCVCGEAEVKKDGKVGEKNGNIVWATVWRAPVQLPARSLTHCSQVKLDGHESATRTSRCRTFHQVAHDPDHRKEGQHAIFSGFVLARLA